MTDTLSSPAISKKKSHHTTTKPCPTVTSTAEVCSTCVTLPCLNYSTISLNQKDCPTRVPTVSTSFPCSQSECPGGCDTSYVYASSYGSTKLTPISTITVCPTVTETETICSDCIRPMCLSLSTVSSVCGCPATAATVTTAFPCGGDCPEGCGTEFVSPTVTPDCK
ncbi:uncharacterized protein B0J16DRAFT_67297 [Fusarium flagelliforme]|uniref:uncharacterized protein n=1 Tax=Fusarium flagelliforme TaxID=2675880 RepID=UPI001E8E58D0|nr:uncharacterized protein B0J16DRAFT_67297 [Fusarium flagelliforme]KAH7192940.1 hypothetical protein B0J16DRAFT_67297 [Fusarium flagelliforme]